MRRIIYDYDSPHIVGREKRSFSAAKIVIGILIVAVAVALVYILFFRKERVKHDCKEYFVVVAGEFSDKESASRSAAEISARGGAGYIVEGEKYEVIVSVYLKENDAEAVAARYGYAARSAGKYVVSYGAEETAISETLSLCESLIDRIYDLSVSLDKGEIFLSAAVYALENFDLTVLQDADGQERLSDKHYEAVRSVREELAAETDKFGSVSGASELKNCLCRVTFIYIKFLKAIS